MYLTKNPRKKSWRFIKHIIYSMLKVRIWLIYSNLLPYISNKKLKMEQNRHLPKKVPRCSWSTKYTYSTLNSVWKKISGPVKIICVMWVIVLTATGLAFPQARRVLYTIRITNIILRMIRRVRLSG